MRWRSEVNAELCFVSESRYLPAALDEVEAAAAEVEAEAESSMPFACDLAAFVGVFLVDGLAPLARADVEAFAEAAFAAAIFVCELVQKVMLLCVSCVMLESLLLVRRGGVAAGRMSQLKSNAFKDSQLRCV